MYTVPQASCTRSARWMDNDIAFATSDPETKKETKAQKASLEGCAGKHRLQRWVAAYSTLDASSANYSRIYWFSAKW